MKFGDNDHTKRARLLVHARQLKRLDRFLARFEQLNQRFLWIRLGIFVGGALLTLMAYQFTNPWFGRIAGLASTLVFGVTVYKHRFLDRMTRRFQIHKQYILTQIARMELDWERIPSRTSGADLDHPYGIDLDIVGERSLHHLMDISVSRGGSGRLQDWLLTFEPNLVRIRDRQIHIQELVPLFGFRSRLYIRSTMVSENSETPWNGERLIDWLEKHIPEGTLKSSLIFTAVFSLANILLICANALGLILPVWLITIPLYFGIYLFRHSTLKGVFDEAYYLNKTLSQFQAVAGHLENYPYPENSHLQELCRPFTQKKNRPSRQLRIITWIASAASLKGNPVIWFILNLLVPWDLFFAHLLQRYKRQMREILPAWLDVWYELEALNALANFAYLNPNMIFPEVLKGSQPVHTPVFEAHMLGHPLIPDSKRVCNDFTIQDIGEIIIITGSNMSGKSTFLRTLGTNLVLTLSGGPVIATCLKTVPFRVYTCIAISDSLADGISYFYAEVRRLKTLLDELESDHPMPLFFLIDEIFRGTNNKERRIGSKSYFDTLANKHGVGLVSTHDLELTHLEDNIPGVYNYHFREEVLRDRMSFDYTLRSGPSPTTNALKIMAMAGLPVSQEE